MSKTVQFTVTEAAVRAYAELTDDFNPIHLDPEFAAKTPMGRPIAHGTMSLSLLWQHLQRQFGPSALSHLQLQLRFLRPVFIGDQLSVGSEPDPASTNRHRVWVRGADGTDRIAGTIQLRTG